MTDEPATAPAAPPAEAAARPAPAAPAPVPAAADSAPAPSMTAPAAGAAGGAAPAPGGRGFSDGGGGRGEGRGRGGQGRGRGRGRGGRGGQAGPSSGGGGASGAGGGALPAPFGAGPPLGFPFPFALPPGGLPAAQAAALAAAGGLAALAPPTHFCIDVECIASGLSHLDRVPAQISLVDQYEQCLLNVYIRPAVPVASYLTPLTRCVVCVEEWVGGHERAREDGGPLRARAFERARYFLGSRATRFLGRGRCTIRAAAPVSG